MAENTILDLDAMMDREMDSVETLPDYVTPCEGAYQLGIADCLTEKYTSAAKPAKDGKPAKAETKGTRIKIVYRVDDVIETQDSMPPAVGSLFSESFMGTEDGLKYFKRQAMKIMNVKDVSGAKLRDLIDGLKNMQFKAKVTVKENAEGFENVRVNPFHETAAT